MIKKLNTIKLKYEVLLEETIEKDNRIISLLDAIKELEEKYSELKKDYRKLLRNKESKKKGS